MATDESKMAADDSKMATDESKEAVDEGEAAETKPQPMGEQVFSSTANSVAYMYKVRRTFHMTLA